jgi:hypothetical protein
MTIVDVHDGGLQFEVSGLSVKSSYPRFGKTLSRLGEEYRPHNGDPELWLAERIAEQFSGKIVSTDREPVAGDRIL